MSSSHEQNTTCGFTDYIPLTMDGSVPNSMLRFPVGEISRQTQNPCNFLARGWEVPNTERWAVLYPQRPDAHPEIVPETVYSTSKKRAISSEDGLALIHEVKRKRVEDDVFPSQTAQVVIVIDDDNEECVYLGSVEKARTENEPLKADPPAVQPTARLHASEESITPRPNEDQQIQMLPQSVKQTTSPMYTGELVNGRIPQSVIDLCQSIRCIERNAQGMPPRNKLSSCSKNHFTNAGMLRCGSGLHSFRRDLRLFTEMEWLYLTRSDWKNHATKDIEQAHFADLKRLMPMPR